MRRRESATIGGEVLVVETTETLRLNLAHPPKGGKNHHRPKIEWRDRYAAQVSAYPAQVPYPYFLWSAFYQFRICKFAREFTDDCEAIIVKPVN